MSDAKSITKAVRVQRATVFGYFLFLVGLYFLANNVKEWLAGGSWLSALSGAVLGAFAIGSAVLMAVNPGSIRAGEDAAPTYLLVLAVVATAFTVLSSVLIFT
jgi:hypothetical protein